MATLSIVNTVKYFICSLLWYDSSASHDFAQVLLKIVDPTIGIGLFSFPADGNAMRLIGGNSLDAYRCSPPLVCVAQHAEAREIETWEVLWMPTRKCGHDLGLHANVNALDPAAWKGRTLGYCGKIIELKTLPSTPWMQTTHAHVSL